MSLIRSTSNPDKVYAWATSGNRIHWMVGSKETAITPSCAFCSFMRAYLAADCLEPFGRFGYRIDEGWLLPDGRWFSVNESTKYEPEPLPKGVGLRHRLTYRGKEVITVWHVTWMYIVRENRW